MKPENRESELLITMPSTVVESQPQKSSLASRRPVSRPGIGKLILAEWYRLTRRTWALLGIVFLLMLCILVYEAVIIASAQSLARMEPDMFHRPILCKYAAAQDHHCLQRNLTASEMAEMRRVQRVQVQAQLRPLHLPTFLAEDTSVLKLIGLIAVVVLAAFAFGDDYQSGTVRMMLTRGSTRIQVFIAQIAVILCGVVGTVLLLILLTFFIGALLMSLFFPGYGPIFPVLSASWYLQAALYVLWIVLYLFVYAMLAACVTILVRSTVGGIIGSLGWWVLNYGIYEADAFSTAKRGSLLDAFFRLSIEKESARLLQFQEPALVGSHSVGAFPSGALLFLLAYGVLAVGLAGYVYARSDVVN